MKVTCKLGKKSPSPPPCKALPKPPSRVVQQLALAYKIEQMIEAGQIRDYADAARRRGITGARISQIAKLINLPGTLQEEILQGQRNVSERRLREHASHVTWHPPPTTNQ